MKFTGGRTLSDMIRLVQNGLNGKQNLLIGTQDQVVGFNASGEAVPIDRSTLKGDPGEIFYPTFSFNPESGMLKMEVPDDYPGTVPSND